MQKASIQRKNVFIFPVDPTDNRGDATHVREFVANLSAEEDVYLVYDKKYRSRKLTRHLFFRLKVIKLCFSLNRHAYYYLRYYPGVSVDLLLLRLLRRKNIFVELNAVLSDEVVDLRANYLRGLLTQFDEKIIKRLAHRLFCVTKEIAGYYGQGKCSASIVENGVNVEHFQAREADSDSVSNSGHAQFVIGFVGSLSPWQDISTLVRALKVVRDAVPDRNVRCVVAGTGGEEESIKALIQECGLQESVDMLGVQPYADIPGIITGFDVCVAPLRGSRLRKTGSAALKVYEYMSMGKPIVLTDCGSLSKGLQSRGFVRTHVAEDVTSLADVLLQEVADSIAADRMGGRQQLSKQAREFVVENHSWRKVVEDTKRLMAHGA
ncbi:glycosyltransferase [Pseudomonadales bacterium]|nr:glycosyltransferase [Pseudomonadales bacterium]